MLTWGEVAVTSAGGAVCGLWARRKSRGRSEGEEPP